jgi:acetyl/propionyl-CoA carboxylase alpha subunit
MLDWPGRPGVRVDSGLRAGSEVTPFYDSLLAKLIAWGSDRDEARRRLIEALRAMTLLGVTTNRPFLLQILERDFFVAGETFTSTLEAESWDEPQPPEEAIAAARRTLATPQSASDGGSGPGDRYSPWDAGAGPGGGTGGGGVR